MTRLSDGSRILPVVRGRYGCEDRVLHFAWSRFTHSRQSFHVNRE